MKNLKLFVAVLLVLVIMLTAVACVKDVDENSKIELGLVDGASLVLTVGDANVDFTKYFKVVADGKDVAVTADMLDLTKVDLTKEGMFNVTISYGGKDYTVTFLVVAKQEEQPSKNIVLGLADGVSLELTVGDTDVDFTKFFKITVDGASVAVTVDMLDLTNVDLTKEGTFDVILSYGEKEYTATFTVVVGEDDELKEIFAKYEDDSTWNFGLDITIKINGTIDTTMIVAYDGWNSYLKESYDGVLCTDYMVYDSASDEFWYLYDNCDGTHTRYKEDSFYFYFLYANMMPVALYDLGNYDFVKVADHYEAVNPVEAGNNLYGEDESCTYTKVELYVEGGLLSKIVFLADIEAYDEEDNYISYKEETIFEFGAYNGISIDISGLEIIDDESGDDPFPDEPVENPAALQEIFDKLADMENWNFAVTYEEIYNGMTYRDYYEYFKYLAMNKWEDEIGDIYVDYLSYDPSTSKYTLWLMDADGTYFQLSDDEYDYYDTIYNYYFIDPSILAFFEFEEGDGFFAAKDPESVAGYFIGYYEDLSWSTFIVTIANGNLKTIEATLDDGTIIRYTFSKYGEIELELPDENGNGGNEDGNNESMTSTFVKADLSVGNGEIEYTSNVGANSLDDNRGLQFLQGNGDAILTSKVSVNGVVSIKLIVNTNADNGMYVSVKVGGVSLTSDGSISVFVAKHAYTSNVELTFVSAEALSGKVEITLKTTQTKQSMYLKSITIVLEGGNAERPDNPNPNPNVMESQNYDPNTFDDDTLQDRLLKEEGCVGLPSEGDINVLVVPVQFAGDTISAKDLEKLNIAFNGTSSQTGWESVKTFYIKSSYGKLNLTFDIQDVFKAPNNAAYYENYSKAVGSGANRYYEYGDTLILTQVLAYLEPLIDLTKYDSNNDGVIDAVYLIYSAPVNYESDDSLFWAFTTWYFGENQYDGLDAYYYLFAGFDFMDEDYGTNGMKVNAETYIHETGHLLGLDDYYDYDYSKGCNFGLGGADMMDFNHGDHGAFSKIMLGWTDATIVDSSVTLTIGNLVATGDCILIPLNFNNSYFSEYLLIDLYSSSSLNEYASEALYDGASYGVRIYHVTAWANDPFNNDYGSYTDYNNTDSEFALIRLVEADGEYNFNSSNGDAAASDLWQAGDSLSKVFASYTRNDGKLVNFDITINSVSENEASITITFKD